jgi:hypothetical protein
VVVATEAFAALAREEAGAQGLAEARIAVVPHPIGGVADARLLERADAAVDAILALFCACGVGQQGREAAAQRAAGERSQ